MHYKSCSRCGRIHDANEKCPIKSPRVYPKTEDRQLRNSWEWQKKSREIREKANYLCEVCKQEGKYTYDLLEVHHINKLKDHPEGLLDNLNLICLCNYHHRLADAGEIKKEYLLKLAKDREGV